MNEMQASLQVLQEAAYITMNANPAYIATNEMQCAEIIHNVPDASDIQEQEGHLQVSDQGNRAHPSVTDYMQAGAVTTTHTVCTAKRLLASLLLPAIICLIVTFILSVALKDVVRVSVSTVLFIVSVGNIVLVLVAAVARKYMKRKKVQPKLVAQQAVNIDMDANPAYITTNGEEYKSCTYDYPYAFNALRQEGVIEMTENPAYVANTDYSYI